MSISHRGPNYPWSHMAYNCHGLFSFFNLEQFLFFWLSFGHWFLKCKGPVVLQKHPQCGFVWGHFFTLWFRFCLLGQGAHRSGVRSPLRTLRTRVPWWRRRLPSFSIVTVPCFFSPLELTSKPKCSRKKSKFGQVYFASALERAGGLHSPAGVWKPEFWLWALQHRAALCPSSQGQRIRCMNACHGVGMPECLPASEWPGVRHLIPRADWSQQRRCPAWAEAHVWGTFCWARWFQFPLKPSVVFRYKLEAWPSWKNLPAVRPRIRKS